jgi:hypothetical protein
VEDGADHHRKNLPTTNKVGVLILDEYLDASFKDIVLAVCNPTKNRRLRIVPISHPGYMPFHYVLLFPRGANGTFLPTRA